jgi:hypothetical protein
LNIRHQPLSSSLQPPLLVLARTFGMQPNGPNPTSKIRLA